MKRLCTLIGSIVAVVLDAIFVIVMLMGLAMILDALSGVKGTLSFAIIALLEIAVCVLALVFNAMVIPTFSASHEKYLKKRGTIIAAIVFNAILSVLALISLNNALIIFLLLASLAAITLYVVDMALESKRSDNEVVTVDAEEYKGE